jgi:hypothetical protein
MQFKPVFNRLPRKNLQYMKKFLVLPVSLLLLAGIFILPSCTKEDTTPPTLQLLPQGAGNNVAQSLPPVKGAGKWVDPGYTAMDNGENLFTQVHVYGSVDPNTKGVYKLTYAVKDAAGNISTQTRTVNIFNDADSLAGTYTVSDTTLIPFATTSYAVTISTDMYTDSVIHFNPFAGLNNDSTVSGTANRLTYKIAVPHQKVTFAPVTVGVNQTHAFTGAGTDSVGALIPTIIHFTFTDSTSTGTTVHHTRWIK